MTELNTVYRVFGQVAQTHADQPFLRMPASAAPGGQAVEWRYGAAASQVAELAEGYRTLGIEPGQRVSLAYDSRLEVYLHLLALNALGASLVPLNLGSTDDEVAYVVGHSESVAAAGAPEHLQRLRRIAPGLPVHDGDTLAVAPATTPNPVGNESTEAALLYTSGTTGKPKGCMLANDYFLTMGRWYNTLEGYARLLPGDRLLTPLPPSHMNALCTSFMGMLVAGGCVVQLDRFHPKNWWQTVREEGATVIHYLGVMPAILLTLPEQDNEDFTGQVRFGFGAGSDPRHQAVFEQRFGFPLIEAWAMSETGAGAVTIADTEPRHVGQRCIGRPTPEMQFRIVDERDADVTPGEPGELLVRRAGDNPRQGFFSGYFRDEAATEEGWRGGWWHTGDVVRADEEGLLYFVDRRKNVIRRSGENIAAVEVETALLSSPDVANCAVTAVPDEIRGDEVFAFIVTAGPIGDAAQTAQHIVDHCSERLSYFKLPGYIAFVDELPLTGSQKVKRGEVTRLAREQLDSNDCLDLRHLKKRTATA